VKRLLVTIVLILLVPAIAVAGLVIEEKISTRGMMGAVAADGRETTYIKGDKIRTESQIKHGGMMAGMGNQSVVPQVTIIRLDRDLVWHLDDDDSTFMEVSLKGPESAEEPEKASLAFKDVKITETDDEKTIAGHTCQGLIMEVTFETTVGGETLEQSAEILFWMAPKTKQFKDLEKVWRRIMETADQGNDMLRGALEGVGDQLKERGGVPLGMEMTMEIAMPGEVDDEEMKQAMQMMRQFMKAKRPGEEPAAEEQIAPNQIKVSRQVVTISERQLDAALFEIPKGYTSTH
jgi:hypothetical protein